MTYNSFAYEVCCCKGVWIDVIESSDVVIPQEDLCNGRR